MGTTANGEQSFPASKAIIGEIEYSVEDNVLTPHRRVTIICTNGGIWDINCLQFTAHGEPTERNATALWNTNPAAFTKRQT
jgi:hypothetical protein